VVVFFGEGCGGVGVSREESEELFERIGLELEIGRELPQDRPEFGAECEQAGGEEVGQRLLGTAEPEHVGDVTAAFDGKDEVGRGLRGPGGEAGGSLQRIECAIDLDGGEEGGAVGEFLFVCQAGGVEVAAPRFVSPARDSDAYVAWQDGRPPGVLDGWGVDDWGVDDWGLDDEIEADLPGWASYKSL
jgi:hypothetical protein